MWFTPNRLLPDLRLFPIPRLSSILHFMTSTATALAHPNIAFIKYWGLKDDSLRLPSNDSLSMNIGCLSTRTSVTLDPDLAADTLTLNSELSSGKALARVRKFLDRVRELSGSQTHAHVNSGNNFPIGAGIASSASGFAALALAATTVYGLTLSEKDLSSLARFGSGSACRSIPGGSWKCPEPQTGDSLPVPSPPPVTGSSSIASPSSATSTSRSAPKPECAWHPPALCRPPACWTPPAVWTFAVRPSSPGISQPWQR